MRTLVLLVLLFALLTLVRAEDDYDPEDDLEDDPEDDPEDEVIDPEPTLDPSFPEPTFDPSFPEPSLVASIFPDTSSSFSGMHFGDLLSVSEGALAVRAAKDNRSFNHTVLIYTRNEPERDPTGWLLTSKVYSPEKLHGPDFATSLAFLPSGALAVGSGGSSPTDGILHVFKNDASDWTLVQTVYPPVVAFGDTGILVRLSAFGSALAVSSALLAVAAYNEAVAIYSTDSGFGLVELAVHYSPGPDVHFGAALSLGDHSFLAVGAPNDAGGAGAVYLYRAYDDDDDAVRKLVPPARTRRLGRQVHLLEDSVAVGAISDAGDGLVLIFDLATMALVQRLTSKGSRSDFGASITSTEDGTLLVGAPSINAVFAFRRSANGRFAHVGKLVKEGSQGLGVSIDTLNATVFAGADLSNGVGEVLVDSAFLTYGLSEPVDEVEVSEDDSSHGYGDNGSHFFDTVPHIIVSALLFIVLPGMAVGSLVFYRRTIGDFVWRKDWRFRVLAEPRPDGEEQEKGSRFKHDSAQEKVRLTREEPEEAFIRV